MLEAAHNPKPKNITTKVAIIVLLIIFNLILVSVIRYLTLDSEANSNSQFGAFLLSFFIPLFIVSATPKMNRLERVLKFRSGVLVYLILVSIIHGFVISFTSGLFTSVLIILMTLSFGGKLNFTRKKIIL